MTPASDKPRVLQVVLSLDPGGTEKLVIEMTRRLRQQTEIAVCCLDEPGVWASELTDIGIPVSALHRRPGFQPSLGARIASLAGGLRADVLHCHHYSPFVYGTLSRLRRPRTRIIYTEHGRLSDAPPSAKRRAANFLFSRLAGDLFAVSNDLRRHLIESGLPASRVGVIHNGIEAGPSPSREERAAARHQLGLAEGQPAVGTIARLDPVKDLGTLIAGFEGVVESIPEARLVIIGDGPERPNLERAAAESGLGPLVAFTGRRDDARDLLPGLDVYVNASVTEGISITILEAMAAGLPVIATRVGGNGEVVVEGETGLLVPARDARAIADGLRALLDEPSRRRSLGAAGRKRVLASFSLDRMVASYLACYRGEGLPGPA